MGLESPRLPGRGHPGPGRAFGAQRAHRLRPVAHQALPGRPLRLVVLRCHQEQASALVRDGSLRQPSQAETPAPARPYLAERANPLLSDNAKLAQRVPTALTRNPKEALMPPFRRTAREPRPQHIRLGGREIEARGLAGGFWSDLYYRSMTVSWPGFFAAAAAIFLALNGSLALVFLLRA